MIDGKVVKSRRIPPVLFGMLAALLQPNSAGANEFSTRTAVAARILAGLPQYTDSSDLVFAVPFPVVKAYFRDLFAPDQADVPVRLIRTSWTAHVSVSNTTASADIIMDIVVLDASPLRPVTLDLFPSDTIYENLTIDGEAVTPFKRGNQFQLLNSNGDFNATTGDQFLLLNSNSDLNVAAGNQFLLSNSNSDISETPGNLALYLTTEGLHRISVRLKPPTLRQNGANHIRLHQDGYALANIHVESAESLEVQSSAASTRLAGAAGTATRGTLAVKGTEKTIDLSWEPYRPTLARQGIPSYSTSAAWTIEEGALAANAVMDVRITGGSRDELSLLLPSGADRIRVDGPDVRDVRIDGSTAQVFLNGRIQGSTQLRISCTVAGRHNASIALPVFQVAGGRATEGGWLTVANDVGGELLEDSISGFQPVASQELPATIRSLSHVTPTFAYQCNARNASATFDLIQTAPFPLVETIADQAEGYCVVRPNGEEIVKLHYDMRNNRAQFLNVKLPEGARILSVSVEDTLRTPSTHNGSTLIPLPRSLQTMDGLISFPLELVYVRKAAPLVDEEQRRIDLPELIGVPTAQVSLTLFLPDDLHLKAAGGRLEQVDRFVDMNTGIDYGSGYKIPASLDITEDFEAAVTNTLYYNYYAQGVESYKQSDFESAERYLQQAVELGGRDDENARGLLKNIKVTSGGEGKVAAPAEKDRARASYITRSTSSLNLKQAGEQDSLIEEGLELIEAGDETRGAQLLEQADKLGSQLTARGEALGQHVVRRSYEAELEKVQTEQRMNQDLKKQVEVLQRQSQEIVKQDQQGAKGQQLIANLNAAAIDNDYDTYAAEELVFSDAAEVTAPTLSLEEKNAILNRQVAVLQTALEQTEQMPAVQQPVQLNKQGQAIYSNARQRLQQTRDDLGRIITDLSENRAPLESGQATWSDVELGEELNEVKRKREALGQVYADSDTLRGDLEAIDKLIETGERKLAEAQRQRKGAKQVIVGDLAQFEAEGLDVADNAYQQQQLVAMIIDNNDFEIAVSGLEATDQPIEVVNGQLAAANFGSNASILNDTFVNLAGNRGNVVSIGGANLDASFLATDNPASRLFNQTTQQGQRYAVLDEAQYRALLSMQSGKDIDGLETAQRVVVPNTYNRVAGQDFRLENTDIDSNGIRIDATLINLEHNRYLAIDNGEYVTVLKGSEEHNWQDQVDLRPELARVDISSEIVFPAVGIPYRFEKTLLVEGESMDMTIEYRLSRRN